MIIALQRTNKEVGVENNATSHNVSTYEMSNYSTPAQEKWTSLGYVYEMAR